ncbi:hypothetical protein WUBG_13026, partial [Wuchereria bancrofti]
MYDSVKTSRPLEPAIRHLLRLSFVQERCSLDISKGFLDICSYLRTNEMLSSQK